MPLFSRLRAKGSQPTSKSKTGSDLTNGNALPKPKYQSNWSSKSVVPEEVEELIHICTAEMKSRGMARLFCTLAITLLTDTQRRLLTHPSCSFHSDRKLTQAEQERSFATSSRRIRKAHGNIPAMRCSKSSDLQTPSYYAVL